MPFIDCSNASNIDTVELTVFRREININKQGSRSKPTTLRVFNSRHCIHWGLNNAALYGPLQASHYCVILTAGHCGVEFSPILNSVFDNPSRIPWVKSVANNRSALGLTHACGYFRKLLVRTWEDHFIIFYLIVIAFGGLRIGIWDYIRNVSVTWLSSTVELCWHLNRTKSLVKWTGRGGVGLPTVFNTESRLRGINMISAFPASDILSAHNEFVLLICPLRKNN